MDYEFFDINEKKPAHGDQIIGYHKDGVGEIRAYLANITEQVGGLKK